MKTSPLKPGLRQPLAALGLLLAAWPVLAEPLQPPKSKADIEQRVARMLREMGDLGAYIDKVDADGVIHWRTWKLPRRTKHQSACGSTPPKTTLRKPSVPADRVQRALFAVDAADKAVQAGKHIEVADTPTPSACQP